jgi:subtilase family serine protease
MKMRHLTAALAIAAMTFASFASIGLAQSASPGGTTSITIPASSIAKSSDVGVRAHTNIRFLNPSGNFNGAPEAYGPPYPGLFYEDPASIACIYDLQPPVPGCNPNVASSNPNGGGRAIAIVDAYDDPNASGDLAAFSAQFGVATPSTFTVVYAPFGGVTPGSCTGVASEPPVDPTGGWEVEESLDIEWAHAMAPEATLYLVEAQSSSFADLLCAVTVASNLVQAAKGGEVSMSWGGTEWPTETSFDPVFTTPSVVYFAAAGDSPGVIYPSASPNVVSAGGTSLDTNPVTGNFIVETVWQDAGSGPSAYESRPTYQKVIRRIVGSQRGTPDLAADANPYTGVWVLDNFVSPDYGLFCEATPCWLVVGGTSVATPMWAGIVNAAGSFSASTNAELSMLYRDKDQDFTDITLGSCGPYIGYFALPGWDFCSGLGSPNSYRGK